MKTLNHLKNQFGEVLLREELKFISGGVVDPRQLTCWCLDGSGGFSPSPEYDFELIEELGNEACDDPEAGIHCYNIYP